jgi:hypothetical protein
MLLASVDLTSFDHAWEETGGVECGRGLTRLCKKTLKENWSSSNIGTIHNTPAIDVHYESVNGTVSILYKYIVEAFKDII